MQIQNLNAWVDVARAEIVEKYQPGEHDKTAGVLQSAHVREGDYFSSQVHHDIDAIMEDIREAHRGRSDSAPEIPLWPNSSGSWRTWRASRVAGRNNC